MIASIRQIVKVEPGGVVRVRSSKLKTGARAEVIVRSPPSTGRAKSASAKSNGSKKRRVPIAKMTDEVRGDIAWAKKVRTEPGANIPWERVKAERGN